MYLVTCGLMRRHTAESDESNCFFDCCVAIQTTARLALLFRSKVQKLAADR